MKKERTFVILKPDAVQRSLVGEIIKRFEAVGLKIVYMDFGVLDEQKIWDHYGKDDVWFESKGQGTIKTLEAAGLPVEKEAIEYGKDIIRSLTSFMTAGPSVTLVLEGNQAIAVVKKLVGGTEPATSDVGTIRGDYTIDSYAICDIDKRAVRNLVHCSDGDDADHAKSEAEREIALWIGEDKIVDYRLAQDAILYDVNLDGILE